MHSDSTQQRAGMIIELQSQSVDGFTSMELKDIVEYLCTC